MPVIKSIQLDRQMVLRILTLRKSREACKGGNMMRDIGAYFYYAKINRETISKQETSVVQLTIMSQLGVDIYTTINGEQ